MFAYFFVFFLGKVFREKIRNISYSFFSDNFEPSVFHFILYPVVSSVDMLGFSVMDRILSIPKHRRSRTRQGSIRVVLILFRTLAKTLSAVRSCVGLKCVISCSGSILYMDPVF